MGTEAKPRYDGFKWFKAGGAIAQVPITCCVSFCPEPVDWDNDGDMDILTGSYPGHLYLYRNNGKGEYAAAEMLKDAEGNFIKPSTSTNPRAHDWKGDGRADMLIGHESAGLQVLFDSAKKGEPIFTKRQVLIRDPGRNAMGTAGTDFPGGRLKMHVTDYNGDGLADLIVGDVNSPSSMRPKKDLSEQQLVQYAKFKKRTDAASAEIGRLCNVRDLSLDRADSGKIQRRIFELLDELGNDFFKTKEKYEERIDGGTHGHVWVFLRKKPQYK